MADFPPAGRPLGGIGFLLGPPIPITQMDLISDLILQRGVGPPTYTRPTIGTFDDVSIELNTTAAIDIARFEINGLLMEGASVNLLLRAEDTADGIWSARSGAIKTSGASVTTPDGGSVTTRFQFAGNGEVVRQSLNTDATNKTYSYYIFIHSTGGVTSIRCDYGDGASQDIAISPTGGFVRINFNALTKGASDFVDITTSGQTYTGTFEFSLWGLDLEPLPFASSYIKTIALPASRAKDTLNMLPVNIPAPTENYTVSMEVDILGLDPTKTFTVYSVDGETDRKCEINTTTGLIEATHGGITVTSTTVMVPGINPEIKVAVDATNITLFVDGVQEAQAVKGTVTGTATAISIGNAAGLNQIYGHVKFFKIFDRVA